MLLLQGYEKKTILKKVNVIERQGKSPLTFVDFVNPDTYESTGDFIFINNKIPVETLKAMIGKEVKASIEIGSYQGRQSFTCVDITLA